jgi:hypothetical protein
LLWVGTAFAIATVAICDLVRYSFQVDDGYGFSLAPDSSTAAVFTSGSATGLYYCYRLAFLGKVVMPQRDSQTADETDATSDGGSASLQTTARALGVALATIFVALHLYHHLPNPATIYVCWPVRIPAFALVWNSVLKSTVIEGLVAACNQTERGLGPGAVLAKSLSSSLWRCACSSRGT